jgi:hypothetical protein
MADRMVLVVLEEQLRMQVELFLLLLGTASIHLKLMKQAHLSFLVAAVLLWLLE